MGTNFLVDVGPISVRSNIFVDAWFPETFITHTYDATLYPLPYNRVVFINDFEKAKELYKLDAACGRAQLALFERRGKYGISPCLCLRTLNNSLTWTVLFRFSIVGGRRMEGS
jgi:hypothetical protein